jgi:hypothetical protein
MKRKAKEAPFQGEETKMQKKHYRAYLALERASDQLARAANRWQKARKELRRLDKRLDKEHSADWRELAKSADQVQDPNDQLQ